MAIAPPTGAKARKTYEILVGATCEEIAATGSFGPERVAARAGTSPATFYAYFSTKDEALVAAFARVLGRMVEMVESGLSIELLLDRGLAGLCRSFVREACRFFDDEALVFRFALARLPESRALRGVYREHQSQVSERYRRFLQLGRAAGKLRGGDPDAMCDALMVVTQGLNNPLVLGRDESDPLLDELAGILVSVLAPGNAGTAVGAG